MSNVDASKERYLCIEAPDEGGCIDFLDSGTVVRVHVADGKVHINVKISHGAETSYWDEHDFEAPLYVPEDDDE